MSAMLIDKRSSRGPHRLNAGTCSSIQRESVEVANPALGRRQVLYLSLYVLHQNSHEKTSSHLVVRVKHEDFRGFCFYFAEVVQITETGTHCELNAAVLFKEGTPT